MPPKHFPQYTKARHKLEAHLKGIGVDIGRPRKVVNLLIKLRETYGPAGPPQHRQLEIKAYYQKLVLGTSHDQTPKPAISYTSVSHMVEGFDVRSDGFLKTRTWRRLRYTVLKRLGAKCQCCGRAKGVSIHVDHIKPRSKYPELALDENNLQVLCEDCNVGKGAWDETDWR